MGCVISFGYMFAGKLSMEYTTVEKAALRAKPAVYDFPWKGGYHPPANDR